MVQFFGRFCAAALLLVGALVLLPVATNAQVVERCPPKPDPPTAAPVVTAVADLMLEQRNVVQLGPRPYYLVDEMKDSPLKETLSM
jgi:hypothetical protein